MTKKDLNKLYGKFGRHPLEPSKITWHWLFIRIHNRPDWLPVEALKFDFARKPEVLDYY